MRLPDSFSCDVRPSASPGQPQHASMSAERRGWRAPLLRLTGVFLAAASLSAPAMGASEADVEAAVVVELGYKLDIVSQNYNFEYANWMLFKDGRAYEALPTVALADFDVAASQRSDPRHWGYWRKDGETLQALWNTTPDKPDAQWKTYKKWFRLEWPKHGDKLNGVYSVIDTSSQSSAYSSFFASGWKQLSFFADGRFEKSAGGSTSHEQNGTEVLAARTAKDRGTYSLDGSLLELRYDDGRTVRASVFFSSSDRKTMFLNGTRLRLQRKP